MGGMRMNQRTHCSACGRSVYMRLVERDEPGGGRLVLLACADCGAEYPSARLTARGVELQAEIDAQRARAGAAAGTPAYTTERERLERLIGELRRETSRP